MKKILICFALIASVVMPAQAITLKTGNWVFDRYRSVDLEHFDYSYCIYSLDYTEGYLELEDGSIWQIANMTDESKSFYEQKGVAIQALDAFLFWQVQDVLIFHKLTNRSSMLVYNASRDQLLDVIPISGPKYPQLQIASIQNSSVMVDNYQ